MRKFWNWVTNDVGGRSLYLDGPISNETWWGDEVTPAIFKEELNQVKGEITVWINSPGGDVFAGAQIYNMLKEYPARVTVKIDGIAASIASVIAMAGDEVLMSPVSTMVVHNPETVAFGNEDEMNRAIGMLKEVKDAVINAYELKTGLSRARISHLMDAESWMNAKTAMELGFADGMLYSADAAHGGEAPVFNSVLFSKTEALKAFMSKAVINSEPQSPFTGCPSGSPGEPGIEGQDIARKLESIPAENDSAGVSIMSLYERLFSLNNRRVSNG